MLHMLVVAWSVALAVTSTAFLTLLVVQGAVARVRARSSRAAATPAVPVPAIDAVQPEAA